MMAGGSEDRTKFSILYETYRYLLWKVAMDVLHDRHLAEDAVQDAFVKIAGGMGNVGETDSRQTKRYLITVAKNAAIDIYRKRNRQMRQEVSADEMEEEGMPSVRMETDMENAVLGILQNLPEKYRDIFLLKYSADMENGEIAKICGIREDAVRQRIARGKKLIEKAIKNLEVDG